MALNKKFAKLQNGKLQYAPRVFHEESAILVPKIDDVAFYLARGWLEVSDEEPEDYDPSEKYPVRTGWTEDVENGKLVAVYELRDAVKQPEAIQVKKLSKLKITLFCIQHEIWDSVKTYLEQIGYYDLFVMAQYFLENDSYFTQGVAQFKEAFRDKIPDVDEVASQMIAFAEDGYVLVDSETGAEI